MNLILSAIVITTAVFCAVIAIPDPFDFQFQSSDVEDFDFPEKFDKFNNKERNRVEDDGYVGRPFPKHVNFIPERDDDDARAAPRRWEDTDDRARVRVKQSISGRWEDTDDRARAQAKQQSIPRRWEDTDDRAPIRDGNRGLDRDDDRDRDGGSGGAHDSEEREGYKTTSESQDNVNQFIDNILNSVGSLGMVSSTRAHIPLPNVRKHFAKKWFMINFTGEATLFNTYIENGLSTIHRLGDAHLSTQKEGDRLTRKIRFEFKIKYLQIASNFTIKFLKHGPSGQFLATSDDIVVGAEITINSRPQTGDINANMDLDVSYWDYIKFKGLNFRLIEMWSSMKKFIKVMKPFVSKMFKRRLTDNIKNKIETLVTQVVREAKLPRNSRALRFL